MLAPFPLPSTLPPSTPVKLGVTFGGLVHMMTPRGGFEGQAGGNPAVAACGAEMRPAQRVTPYGGSFPSPAKWERDNQLKLRQLYKLNAAGAYVCVGGGVVCRGRVCACRCIHAVCGCMFIGACVGA